MFRRSRFSVRPNVGTTGRTTAATAQEAPSSNQEATETPKDTSTSSTPTAVTETTPAVTPPVTSTASGDGRDHSVEGSSSSAAVQRRKRFSVKPKVAPGRISTIGRTPKSPIKSVSETPVEVPSSDLDKPTASSQTGTTAAPQGLQSPRRRRPSEESKQPKVQPKITRTPSDSSDPPAVPLPEELLQKTNLTPDAGKQSESKSESQVKDVPPRPQVLFSLPDKETVELSEKAKTLVSSKSGRTLAPSTSLSKLLNDPSDLQRLAKAQKLRELLRQERQKDMKVKRSKIRVKEYTLDPSKMTMSDLVHYLPLSNPMTSSLEDTGQENENENETVVPPSPGREESPESAQEPAVPPKEANPMGEEEEDEEEDEQDESLMVPQLKVAEDGSLIIDEESLTVEVLRAKGPNPAQERDPIFERGSTTTYSSFKTVTHTKPWTNEETDMFFLAISMVGTDFSMISQLFPHRVRAEIKNKFKKEERLNSWRIDKAFRERRKLDIEYFSKLLEKILEYQKNKKKLKALAKKNAPTKSKRKSKGKKATSKLSDVEEEEEEDDANEVPDLDDEEGGEKENEDLCNEGKSSVSKPKRQRKRKTKQADSNEEPKQRKRKKGEKSTDQDEACLPEGTEAALPEEHTSSDIIEKTEDANPSKDTAVKPAQLSRGRAPKSLVSLGRKWGKKPPPDPRTDNDATPDNGDDDVCDGAAKEQVNKESSPLRQASKKQSADGDVSSEEEPASVQPPRPTRYGRMPKPVQPLNYPAKEDAHSSASDATPGSPMVSTASTTKPKPKSRAKRVRKSEQQSAQVSKKPKLVTLRASQTTYGDDEDDEKQQDHAELEEEEEEEQFACSLIEDGSAPVFVPASLRSPRPVISQVEETMEELDILANIPDVLGISQDALCPGVSWEQAQNETGIPEPCEHQLDLLVDVIDFLSSEHKEVCEDESYNEAAQTLLAIGNPTHLPQTAQNQLAAQEHTTEILSVSAKQTGQHLEEAAFQEASNDTLLMFGLGDGETSETCVTVEQQHAIADSSCIPMIKTSDQTCDAATTDPSLQLETESSKQNYPQTRKGRLSKVKPKPNLDRSSKSAQPKSQPPDTRAAESNSETANHHQVTETLSIPEETIPHLPEFSSTSSIDDISCTKVKLAEKQLFSQEGSSAVTSDQSISESQSHCFSDAQFEESGKRVNRDTQSTSESTSETQAEQGSNTDSVPLSPISQHTAAFVTPAEDLPVGQKEVTSQSRCSRLQKVKPKPNIPRTSRTARLTPQTQDSKDSAENDSTRIFPNFQEKAMVELEPEEKCGTSPEKTSHGTGPAPALVSSYDPESTLSPTMELSSTEEKRIDDGIAGQLHFAATTSGQSGSENQSLSDVSFKPSSSDTGSTSATIHEKGATKDRPAESSVDLLTSLSAVTVSQAGQESKEHHVTPVDDVPVLQKAESEGKTSCQSRRNRLQKVKPNIPQTSRTHRSTHQTTKDCVENDYNPTPVLKAVESSCDSASTLSTTQELPTSEKEKRTDDGHIGQVFSVASTSDLSVSEKQIFSDISFEPINKDTGSTSAATDQKLLPQNEMTENTDISVTLNLAATESQAGYDLAAVMESTEDPATHVTPVEDISVSQKEVSDATSVSQSRSSRFLKVKPKPNIPQTSRTARLASKTKDKKGSAEKDSNPTPISKIQEKAIEEIEPEGDCGTSPEKPSHSVGPATALMSSCDPESTLAPTMELSTTEEEKKTDDGLVGQLHFAATSGHSGSENQSLNDVPFKPISRDTGSTSATIDEKGSTQDKPVESSVDLLTSLSAVTVSQAGQESREHPATHVTPVDDLPVLHKAEREVKTYCQSRRNRIQKVKPKPNIPQTPRTPRSTPQTTKDCVEKDDNPTPVLKAVVPSCDSVSTLSTTLGLPASEKEKRTDDGHIGHMFSVASTSGQSVSFGPINEDRGSTSATTDQKSLTQSEMTENTDICVTSDSTATESQAGHDLAAVTETSEDPVTHVTDISVRQKEVSDATSVSQSRSSRYQKVKPKPNIPQTSRTALLASRTKDKKGSAEKDSNPTPILKIQEKSIVEIEPEGDCGTSPEKPSHSVGPATALMSSFDPESTLSPTMELSKTEEEKRTDDGLVGQLHLAVTSGHSGSENQSLNDVPFKSSSRDTGSTSATIDEKGSTQDKPAESSIDLVTFVSAVAGAKDGHIGQVSSVSFEPNIEDTGSTSATTDQKRPAQNEITESSDIPVTSDSAATESQAGQGLAAVTESSKDPATHVTPVDVSVGQKEQNEVSSTCQPRRSRSQKVKPKPLVPQRSRTARLVPQTTKDSNPTPISELPEKIEVQIEQEIKLTSSENQSQIAEPPSVLVTSFDFGSSPATTKEMSTTEKGKRTDGELVGQTNTVGVNEPNSKASTDDTTESSDNLLTPDSAPTETQTGQDVAPLQKSSDDNLTRVTPVSPKRGGEVTTVCQPRRGRFLKVKPKPNLVQSSRTVESKPQVIPAQLEERPSSPTSKSGSTDNAAAEVDALPICTVNLPVKPKESTNTSSVSMSSLETCTTQNTTEELPATMKQKTELALNSSSDSSESKAPQRRRHFPKVKPNVGSSTRPVRTKPEPQSISSSSVTLEKQPVDNSQTELNRTDTTQSALDESEKRLASTHDKSMSSHVISTPTSGDAEIQIDSVIDNKSSEMSTLERESTGHKMLNTQPPDNSTVASGDGHTVSRTELPLFSNETQLSIETGDAEQTSNDKLHSAQSTDPAHSALSDSSKSSKEALQTRRSRLIKPKPNLGRGSRPLRPQVQNSTQSEADSKDRDASVSHDPVSKLQPDTLEPVECPPKESLLGRLTQMIDPPSSNDAASPLECLTQVLETSYQNTPMLTTEGETQSHPRLTLFPHMTSEQVPSDQDEPFFILSLTEIPVDSSGELVEPAAEPVPFVGETSIQQQSSVSGESSTPAGEGDPVSTSTEVISEMGFFSLKDVWLDSADNTDPIIENQVDPLEKTAVQPSKLQETVDDNKTGSPPTKQRLTGTGRRAKPQVKPHTVRRTRASKSENANLDSELPGPSVQPEGSAGSDLLTEPQERSDEPENTEKESPAGEKGPEDGRRTGARTQTPRAATRKGSSDTPSSDPSSGKAASKGSKVKTPQTRRKHSKPSPAASPPLHVAASAGSSRQPEEIHSASTTSAALEVDVIQQNTDHSQQRSDPIPSTSQCTEVSTPQQSPESSVIEEEPTNVSQYFLSDIFTEVEEG